jgi:hypothetical protein
MNPGTDIDKNVMAENIQRTVEHTALRKVRNLVDDLEAEETAKSRLEKRALIIAFVVVSLFAVWLVHGLIASDEKFERGQSIQMPDKVAVPKKD